MAKQDKWTTYVRAQAKTEANTKQKNASVFDAIVGLVWYALKLSVVVAGGAWVLQYLIQVLF